MAGTPLERLGEHGQSVWLDYISRELVTSGGLERLMREANVTGLTSNPTIFEKAISTGTDYDGQIRELVDAGVGDPNEIFLSLAISDIRQAADILRPAHDRSGGADGFASLEVPPGLAHDTVSTVATARRVWERVDRPNLMVKIPATREGIPAIQTCIAAGININVTLIFSLRSYREVIGAYLAGLSARREQGRPPLVHSVASFFVSRVDTAVDRLLGERVTQDPGNPRLQKLLGRAAIANAVLAYELFDQTFNRGGDFAQLREGGARPQRPLWASTSAKNPSYRDVVYAEALIGPDTVDTMPPATIEAFQDHGIVEGDTVNADFAGAHRVMAELAEVGIDMEQVTQQLLDEGVGAFASSYDGVVRAIAEKVDLLHGGYAGRQRLDLGDAAGAAEALEEPRRAELPGRIWRRDADLWKPGDAHHLAVIRDRLGWLDVIQPMRQRLPELLAFSAELRDDGVRRAVLLGMGGSSLCPEVLRTSFGSAAGHPLLEVLDTTDPEAIRLLTESLDPRTSHFIVASKSGTTLETRCHLSHFWELVESAGVPDPGRHFSAVTDPGSPLAEIGRERSFRRVFENPADIGGRYSALSLFGLVPAAVMGLDLETMLRRAAAMRAQCAASVPADLNCGLELGWLLGELGRRGRDKVTILAPPPVAAFSLWAEQLIAESTGKEGRGLIPVGQEPIGPPEVYAEDRIFVVLRLRDGDHDLDARVADLRTSGQPVLTLQLNDLHDLGAEFFRWEFATAVAGARLGIDPFDEPNVQESKDNTNRVLASAGGGDGSAQPGAPSGRGTGADPAAPTDVLEGLVRAVQPGDYVALMAYLTPGAAHERALQGLRTAIRDRRRVATTLGFGPRFLHSTGQLHKGGPNTGVLIQITADDAVDVPVPGRPFSFSKLKRAQADGDLESLRAHRRRVGRLHLEGDIEASLDRLAAAVSQPVRASA